MNLLPSEIFRQFKDRHIVVRQIGDDIPIRRFAPVETCGAGDLVFVDHAKYLGMVRERKPAAVVTDETIAAQLEGTENLGLLVAPNVRLAIALLRQTYDDRDVRDVEWPRIHPSAVVHESAAVPADAVIGPGVVIGASVRLGDGVVVMANAVIERGASIGAGTVIHPGCIVGYGCEVGAEVILKAGCVVGSEGFGFAQDRQRRNYRIPQSGTVVIEDRVVIGANTNIDRATYGATVIRSGAIVDAMCHIAHNVEIGEDCILCAFTGISGSTRFGKRVVATGQTGTLDHITVADDVMLLHRAGVHNSIKLPGAYAGGPAQPLKEYLKNMAVLPKLHEMWARLKRLEKKLSDMTGE
jgi:UDP-3-O-[3-hydroxymyristoyl] glucosamine N-acyltransferase